MDWSRVKGLSLPGNLAVKKVSRNGVTLWEKQVAPVPSYRYIDPIDPAAFPNYTGLWAITLFGTENWEASGGAVYTSDYSGIIKNQSRASIVGFCADYTFQPTNQSVVFMDDDCFIFNGSSSSPVNGNLSFKDAHTTSASVWTAYLAEHPVTILISVNNPDQSVWKPALRIADGVTGYWDGASGFVAIYGGIPYYGDNLITQDVITAAYDNAWISSQYAWTTASGSVSFSVPVTAGKRYRLAWDNTDSDVSGTIFRYGFTDRNTPSSSNTLLTPRDRTTPQDVQSVEVNAAGDYLVIQVASGTFPGNAAHLTVREMVGYQPPALMMAPPAPEPEPDEGEGEPEPDEGGEE